MAGSGAEGGLLALKELGIQANKSDHMCEGTYFAIENLVRWIMSAAVKAITKQWSSLPTTSNPECNFARIRTLTLLIVSPFFCESSTVLDTYGPSGTGSILMFASGSSRM